MSVTKTIGEYLAAFGGTDHIAGAADMAHVRVVEARWCSSNSVGGTRDDCVGLLQVSCGGECIIAFIPDTVSKRAIYLIVDSMQYDVWQQRMREGKTFSEIGICPHKRLRLVQSA